MKRKMNSINTIESRLAETTKQLPDKIAIDDGKRKLSYLELYESATRISTAIDALRKDDVSIIGILSENHINAITSMLGVAKTGHAYVMLDPQDPDERLKYIIEDCQPIILLVDKALADRATSLVGRWPISCIEDLLVKPAKTGMISNAKAENLLYVIYTSGSTGQPKGVRQTQRNLLFFVDAYAKTIGISDADRLSMLYTLSFSASNMDIYGALLNGATLCTYNMRRQGIPGLSNWLTKNQISILHCVPTVLRELTRSVGEDTTFPCIRAIDLGGEAVFAEDIARFKKHLRNDSIFVNHLAATEASVIAQFSLSMQDSLLHGAIPAGKSPEGVMVKVLRDRNGTPADAGETGFIAIESPYLSPGYHNRPDLDNTVFSPVENKPEWRRYISGDMGRIDDEGNLHFIGRESSRIKLRGQSIDLSEVEAGILACRGVSEAAVIPYGKPGKEPERLIACLVMTDKTEYSPISLRQQLSNKLPSYMLPGGYIFMDALPRTPSGKIDRLTLSKTELNEAAYRADYAEPADDTERRIADIFSEILDRKPIGRLDDFFLMGGDSINMVGLQLQLRKHFGIDLPDLHEDATVANIALKISSQPIQQKNTMPRLVPLRTKGKHTPLFLVHGRLGQAFVSPHFVHILGDEQPLFALQARGLDGTEPPCSTIKEMALEYVKAMRNQQATGPYFIGALCAGTYVAIEMARLLNAEGKKVLPLLLFDPPPPFSKMSATREKILKQLKKHKEKIKAAPTNMPESVYINASITVAQAFEHAIQSHEPTPYEGDAFILASRRRLSPQQWNVARLYKVFGKGAECYPVADTHSGVMDPANPQFAKHLSESLAKIHAGVLPFDNIRFLPFDYEKNHSGSNRWWRYIRRMCGL